MSADLWDNAAALALRLPGRGKRSVRVTRLDSGEYVATACVSSPDGMSVEECAAALAPSADGALVGLAARIQELRS